MVLNARTPCVLIVHEETAPISETDKTCGCDCICRFNVTQVLPILPVECRELGHNGACGRCEICKLLAGIACIPKLSQLTNVYCAGIVVIQRGYLIPDYCTPIFKGLFGPTCSANPLELEAIVYSKFGGFMKRHIIAKTLEMFKCGVQERGQKKIATSVYVNSEGLIKRHIVVKTLEMFKSGVQEDSQKKIATSFDETVCPATSASSPTGQSEASTEHESSYAAKQTVIEDRRIIPIDARDNTPSEHTSMSHNVHEQRFSTKGTYNCT